jgi:hypothetical protein
MKSVKLMAAPGIAALVLAAGLPSPARAQGPIPVVAPIVVDTAVPIIVSAIKPTPKPSGLVKFDGFVMHANIAQITVRAKGNDLAVRTFPLSQAAAAKMQQIVDKGGYQFGDKVTVLYDPASQTAVKIKGKPSKAL